MEYSANVMTFIWYWLHAPLPHNNDITNYYINGKNYTSLILTEMTSDDYGLYIFNVTSICGYTSSVNVTINGTIEGDKCSGMILSIVGA